MDYQNIITIEPGKRSGKPCIRGMRITVDDILEYFASGMTEAEILEDFSELTPEDIKDCLAFAADCNKRLKEKQLIELREKIAEGTQQIRDGKIVDGELVFQQLQEKLNQLSILQHPNQNT